MATTEAIEDFTSPIDVAEHVRELLDSSGWALSGVGIHYRILVPGLLYDRVPGAVRALQEYAQQNPTKLPTAIVSRFPIIRLRPGSSCASDRDLLVMPEETSRVFFDAILAMSFVDHQRNLVVWSDLDDIRIPSREPSLVDAGGSPMAMMPVTAIILRSNHGCWRFRPSASGPPEAVFYKEDAGNFRMRKFAEMLDVPNPDKG